MSDQRLVIDSGISLPFEFAVGAAASTFLLGLAEGRILGVHCPRCCRVLVPARGFCPRCLTDPDQLVEVGPRGTLTNWTAVPEGETRRLYGTILFDNADTALLHRLSAAHEYQTGMTVEAHFRAERCGSLDDIVDFRPLAGYQGNPL